MTLFQWVNIIGNAKTGLSGAYPPFLIFEHGNHCFTSIAYRFNRWFNLKSVD